MKQIQCFVWYGGSYNLNIVQNVPFETQLELLTRIKLRNQWQCWIHEAVVAAEVFEIGTAAILATLYLDERLSQTETSCVPKFCYQLLHCYLIR